MGKVYLLLSFVVVAFLLAVIGYQGVIIMNQAATIQQLVEPMPTVYPQEPREQ